jgi:hypothetical protein
VLEIEGSDPYSTFIYGMRSPKTKEKCIGRFRTFLDFIQIPGEDMIHRCKVFCEMINSNNTPWLLANILKFLQYQREKFERKEIAAGTVKNYYQAVKLFCDMNDIPVPWKKIRKGLPRVRKFGEDRAPTIEEIRKIIEYPDRRIKAIVCTMVSSGIRVGAWDFLKFKHIAPLKRDGKIVAAKLIVYAGEDDEYFTFISSEAYYELEKWRQYRIQSGEPVTTESWVMRNIWNTKKGYTRGLVSAPVKLQSEGVKRLVEDALWTQGVRGKLGGNKKRHEFQTDHGFRKFFKTRCELSKVNSLHIEILMNHSIGISVSYMKPTEEDLLTDYLNAVDSLTLNTEYLMQKQVDKIKQENKDNEYIIRGKLQEKEQEIQLLNQRDSVNADAIATLSEQEVARKHKKQLVYR